MTPHRRLPHLYPEGKALFVTWHLHGSLPASRYPPGGDISSGRAFVWIDQYLDTVQHGPLYLRQPEIARLVVGSIHKGAELAHYELHAFVVMANHVHLLVDPKISSSHPWKSLKGVTAREANRILGRTGQPFWQKESYGHWVRDQTEFERIRAYLESNPVKAGLVEVAEQYPWSSAGVEKSLDAARRSAYATLPDS
jgi:putative transposase